MQAFCEPGSVEGNGVLAFTQHVLFPILAGRGRCVYNHVLYMYCIDVGHPGHWTLPYPFMGGEAEGGGGLSLAIPTKDVDIS